MSKKLKYLDFDITAFLQDYDVDYKNSGKNIGVNWLGIEECPFCGVNGYHFGINLITKRFHCWGCEEKGNPERFIKEITNSSWNKTKEILLKYTSDDVLIPEDRISGKKVILPTDIIPINSKGIKYLKNRGFDTTTLIPKYKLEQTDIFSKLKQGSMSLDYRWRIFIPIYMNRELVSYTARDYTGKRSPKYQHPYIESCIIPPSSCIYNIDTVKDRCIVVEGPTDVWKLGDGAVSIQGITYTKKQIKFLNEKNLSKIVVMFDYGKENEARSLAHQLATICSDVRIASLKDGDPGDLDPVEALKIKHELLYM